jgi:hypothetical protein
MEKHKNKENDKIVGKMTKESFRGNKVRGAAGFKHQT